MPLGVSRKRQSEALRSVRAHFQACRPHDEARRLQPLRPQALTLL